LSLGGPLSSFLDVNAVSYSEASANLNAMIDKVVADRAPLAITRERGEGAVLDFGKHWAPIEETL
jgi:antitoxin YefM